MNAMVILILSESTMFKTISRTNFVFQISLTFDTRSRYSSKFYARKIGSNVEFD